MMLLGVIIDEIFSRRPTPVVKHQKLSNTVSILKCNLLAGIHSTKPNSISNSISQLWVRHSPTTGDRPKTLCIMYIFLYSYIPPTLYKNDYVCHSIQIFNRESSQIH